jgi:hypothetical protein
MDTWLVVNADVRVVFVDIYSLNLQSDPDYVSNSL